MINTFINKILVSRELIRIEYMNKCVRHLRRSVKNMHGLYTIVYYSLHTIYIIYVLNEKEWRIIDYLYCIVIGSSK